MQHLAEIGCDSSTIVGPLWFCKEFDLVATTRFCRDFHKTKTVMHKVTVIGAYYYDDRLSNVTVNLTHMHQSIVISSI